MRGTRKGIITVFAFLWGIPLIVDIIAGIAVPNGEFPVLGVTRFMVAGTLGMIPFYVAYRILYYYLRKLWIAFIDDFKE